MINFYSVRDLRTKSQNLWSDLESGNNAVLTNNGKPSGLILPVPEGALDDLIRAVRQAQAMIAFNNMRRTAAENGYMTDDEINAIVDEARNS
jgi:antitoxin (DNA-binding transcriptional repressor) of toxin-antitoxin stability system